MNFMSPRRKLSDELVTGDRDAYLEFVSANLCHVTSGPTPDAQKGLPAEPAFTASISVSSVNDFTIARASTSSGKMETSRTQEHIARDLDQPRYAICLPVSGGVEVEQFGRSISCAPDALAIMSGADPFTFRKLGNSDLLGVLLPRGFVEERVVNPEDACARAVGAPSGMQRLVFSAISALQEEARLLNERNLRAAIGVVGELVVLAVANLADVRSSESPVRAANLKRAKRIVRERCDNPELTLTNVAVECGLSLRYLHDLFRDDGRTFREYIMCERLQRARRMLESGSPLTTKVTDVCLASGFSNLSHFSTAFRRAFSISPIEVLRARQGLPNINRKITRS
jgi:AraC-like DNA-binding protein